MTVDSEDDAVLANANVDDDAVVTGPKDAEYTAHDIAVDVDVDTSPMVVADAVNANVNVKVRHRKKRRSTKSKNTGAECTPVRLECEDAEDGGHNGRDTTTVFQTALHVQTSNEPAAVAAGHKQHAIDVAPKPEPGPVRAAWAPPANTTESDCDHQPHRRPVDDDDPRTNSFPSSHHRLHVHLHPHLRHDHDQHP